MEGEHYQVSAEVRRHEDLEIDWDGLDAEDRECRRKARSRKVRAMRQRERFPFVEPVRHEVVVSPVQDRLRQDLILGDGPVVNVSPVKPPVRW